MASKREIIKTPKGRFVQRDSQGGFVVPRGKDVTSVTRDASRQVIEKYSPALEKLKKH